MKSSISKNKLFMASCFALITTSMTFAIRAKLEFVFNDQYSLTFQEIGSAFAPAFWGFTLAMMFGGFFVDLFGMKRIMNIAFVGHLLGIGVTIFARDYWTLFWGTTLIGIANGMVEAACNPLVATLYPKEKTKMLNRFHVWFPGGIVIGSALGFIIMDFFNLSWMILVSALIIPLIIYGYLFFNAQFPETERVSSGISYNEMIGNCFKPLFIFMVICMMLTAATELGSTQRIESLLKESAPYPILVLAFINGLMALGRLFAGEIAHRLSITNMLILSAVFSCLGLFLLANTSGNMIFVSAAVFAVGVCYFWPTMLSFVSEKIPESGALGLSLMGGAGMLSVSIVLPQMGKLMDKNISGSEALMIMAYIPAILIIAFTLLHFYVKAKKI
ncbi:MFS transporter [Flavobacteriaceae bacterium]|nr:MFS transporter [Flavobacteriaceae bacterium]